MRGANVGSDGSDRNVGFQPAIPQVSLPTRSGSHIGFQPIGQATENPVHGFNRRSRLLQKIFLALLMVSSEEWLNATRDLCVGSTVTGVVRVQEPFGSFVEIGAPKPALLHLPLSSDGNDPKDPALLPRVGEQVHGIIAGIDDLEQRIILSLRQDDINLRNSWDQLVSTIPIGSRLEATIENVVGRRQVMLNIGSRFRCLLPLIEDDDLKVDRADYRIGDTIRVEVVGFDNRLGFIVVR